MKQIFISILLVMLALSAFGQDTKSEADQIMEAWTRQLTDRKEPSEEAIAAEYTRIEGTWELFWDGESQGIRIFTGLTGDRHQKMYIKAESLTNHVYSNDDYRYIIFWPYHTQADRMTIVLKRGSDYNKNYKYELTDGGNTMIWTRLDKDSEWFGTEDVFKRVK